MTSRLAARGLAAAVALAVVAPAGCSDGGPGQGEARLEVDGTAIVERDGERETVHDSADLSPGDRVEITDGIGRLQLSDGVRMELRAGLDDADHSVLVMGDVPVLEAGDLLVAAPDRTEVEAAGTLVEIAEGAAQLSRQLGVGVAAYDALVHLDSAGQERDVPALREMQVPALGRPPRQPRPLTYDGVDPWDRRFLGDAMALGERLESLASGYTGSLRPGEGRTPGFFRLVLPGLEDEAEFVAGLIDVDRAPGETLIGAAIADLGKRDSFARRWTSVFGFRDQGAAWGLVALDQAVSGTPLLGTIEEAVGSSPLSFAAPAVSSPAAPTSPSTPGSPAAPPGGDDGTPAPGSPTPPAPSPTEPPPTLPPPPSPLPEEPDDPLPPPLDPVTDPVTDLVDGLLDDALGALDPP